MTTRMDDASIWKPVAWSAALLALLLSCRPAAALDPERPLSDYTVDVWQERVGLPQKFVNTIRQTRDGYIWVGTKGGLARFDGLRFKPYDDLHANQLTEGEVWAVEEDDDGSLWIGTYGGGLSHLRKDGAFVNYTTKTKEKLPENYVAALAKGADGSLWVGTTGGLARFKDGRFVSHTKEDGLPGNGIQSLHFDKDGVLWIGTDQGLASYTGGRFVNHAAQHAGQLDGPVGAIAGSSQEGLWFGRSIGGGRSYGLCRMKDGVVSTFTTSDGLPSDAVTSVAIDMHGTVWVGTLGGLCRYRRGRFEAFVSATADLGNQQVFEGFTLRHIQSLFADREGSLWVGTRYDGLARLRDTTFSNVTGGTQGGIDVNTVYEDSKGAIWLGTGAALKRLKDGVTTVFTLPEGLGVNSFVEDRAGTIWIGTLAGVFKIEGDRPVRVPLGPLDKAVIAVLVADQRGNVWIGTRSAGLYRYASGDLTRYSKREGMTGDQIRGLALDSTGALWIATRDGGVSCLRNGQFTPYGVAEGLPHTAAQAIYVDRDDAVWVATRTGLCRIKEKDNENRVRVISAQHGLPANYFYQIIGDNQKNIWLTYGRGIVHVAHQELDAVADKKAATLSAIFHGTESGIRSTAMVVSNQPAAWLTRAGALWFATARGAAVVDAKAIAPNPVPPPVHIEEVSVDGKIHERLDGLVLPAGSNTIEIHYTGLSLMAPERVRFKYKLEGFDKGLVDAGERGERRVAYYTNLPPGRYRFRVIACNADGIWNDQGEVASFRLKPKFHQYLIVQIAAAAIVALLAFAVYLWRVREMKNRERDLATRVEERTRDLRLAEEEAGRERDLLHALMDNIPDLIYFKDTEGRYARINRAHAEALGLTSPAEAVGKTDFDFHEEAHARAAREDEREVLTQGRALVGKAEYEARSGRWYLATKVPLSDKAGRFSGLVGISKDITERKSAEEKLDRDLQTFLTVMNQVARGDLTQRGAEGDDTLGRIARSVNEVLANISTILGGVRDAAFSVSTSATEILAAATEIAKGAQYGRDEVHTTSSAVEEMAASMTNVSRNAEQSAQAAQEVLSHLRASEASVNAAALGMTRIDGAVSETAEKMRLLEKRSKQIFEIIGLIEEISSQSTLLSLNAAIEAAHAGDAGRGFSVVADEIRRLAERSNESTKAVTAIVEGIVEETRLVLAAMENGIHEVHGGRELSDRAQQSLQTIQALVERSAAFSEQISRSSHEQAQATQTVSQAMQTIAGVAQQSSAGANETSRAVRDLVDLSEQLTRAIARFKIEG